MLLFNQFFSFKSKRKKGKEDFNPIVNINFVLVKKININKTKQQQQPKSLKNKVYYKPADASQALSIFQYQYSQSRKPTVSKNVRFPWEL